MTTTAQCVSFGGFGLDRCKGEVSYVNGTPLCLYHQRKREVFGVNFTPPEVKASQIQNWQPCPTCGQIRRVPE